MRSFFVVALALSLPALAFGQEYGGDEPNPDSPSGRPGGPPRANAVRVDIAPDIDGRLDDAAWSGAPVIADFTQRDPVEGAPASERTEVRIVYDDQAIYIGARLHDSRPVSKRLGRRDMQIAGSDWFRVSFDSYFDRRTAFRFDVNPSGVRRDGVLSGGGGFGGGFGGGGFSGPDGDLSWDAVWDAAATEDEGGWTVEMRIPFSQLRFSPAAEQIWGVQLERIIDRTQELALFAFTPKSEPGGVAAFGELHGLSDIRPGRPLEVIPYGLTQGSFAADSDNDLVRERDFELNAGLDARYRLTSNIALTATINPDFGQVEVDPAIINLTAFETRLFERRPFFVEGANSFRFGGGIIGPGGNAANLLYSRRVGRAPQLRAPGAQAEPAGVTGILGAAKVSGKTADGWNLGVLYALTGEETRRYLDGDGREARAVVEPMTHYVTGNLNREFRLGQSAVGGMLTAVRRDVSEDRVADALHSEAFAGGFDFIHEWANRSWALGGYVVGSLVRGSAAALKATQESSGRYFQRPDSDRLAVDPTRTALSGYAGTIQLRKPSGQYWTGDIWVGVISPGFETNDLGFLQRVDRIATGGMLRFNWRQPGSILRNWNASVSQNHAVNYDGDLIERTLRANLSLTHLNYWGLSFATTIEPERMDDRLTRGGPLARLPTEWSARFGIDSDPRKSVIAELSVNLSGNSEGSRGRTLQGDLEFRISPNWNLTLSPRWQRSERDAQFVTSLSDPLQTATFGRRYIFAPLEQSEFSIETRLNWTFTPNLSLEIFAQPLVSNGEYGTPMEFQRPSAYDFAVYGRDRGTLEETGGGFTIDPDGDGPAEPFTLHDRSFTRRSLRGNAVLRWEYRPGSTLYLVWQQHRSNGARMDDFSAGRAMSTLLDAPADNVLVLKWSYWFNP